MISILQVFLITFIIVNIKIPYEILNRLPYDKIKNKDIRELLRFFITQPFRCYKCMGFWLGLFIFGFWIGAITSFIFYILEKNEII